MLTLTARAGRRAAVGALVAAVAMGLSVAVPSAGSTGPPPADGSPGTPHARTVAGKDARLGASRRTSRHFLTSASSTGRYFLDQHGRPMMLRGDTTWGLVSNAGRYGHGTTWRSDIADYVAARAAEGFNTVYVAALGHTVKGGRYDTGATWDGVSPWVGGSASDIGPHVGTLNDHYWKRVDYLLSRARAVGITVMLDIIHSDDIGDNGLPGAMVYPNQQYPSDAQMRTYGRLLGERYKSFPNLVWMIGGDYFGVADPKVSVTLKAIRAVGAKQLISVENWDKSTSYSTGIGREFAQWSDVYTYAPTYRESEKAWAQKPTIPLVWTDGYYDQNSGADNNWLYRQQVGWALTSGSRGSMYAQEGLWPWSAGSLHMAQHPDTAARQVLRVWKAVSALPRWYRLVPDIRSTRLLTGDRGTKITSDAYYLSPTNDYITGSITPDGTLALIYLPRGGTVHLTWAHMQPRHRTAKWLDPTTGRLTSTVADHASYTTPGPNAAGQSDWYLVLQGSASRSGR